MPTMRALHLRALNLRGLSVGLAALVSATAALAQFDGPAPLAWRWVPNVARAAAIGAPLVNNGMVYMSAGGRIFALDKETGNKRWQFPPLDPIEGTFKTSPILAGNVLVAPGDNKQIYGIDPNTGDSKWNYLAPASLIGQPVLVGKFVVFAMSDNSLMALNPDTGEAAWAVPYRIFNGIVGSLGASGSDVLLFTGRQELQALNVTTQKTDWKRQLEQVPPNATPVVSNGAIYINSGSYLVSITSATGIPRWQIRLPFVPEFSPTVSASSVLVVSNEGYAQAFDFDHKPLTKKPIDLESSPMVQPSATGDIFVIPTTNGAINLLDPKKGDLLWSYLVKPLPEALSAANQRQGGNGFGAPPGGGGVGRGGGQGGGQGNRGRNGQNNQNDIPTFVQASGPAVVSGKTLLIPARDGSLLAFDPDLGVDLTPPDVKMLFPNPGDQVSGLPPLIFQFKVEDEASGIRKDSLKIQVDGKDLAYELEKNGTITVRFSTADQKMSTKPVNKPLSDGRKVIEITVSDWMNNKTIKSFSLTIDNTLRPVLLPGQQDPNQRNPGFPGGPPGGGGKGGRGGGGGAGGGGGFGGGGEGR